MDQRERYFIIAIDGGGCRGVIPSMVLQSLGNDILRKADLFAGTSTGAILAGGLACGIHIDEINDVYQAPSSCRTIFTPYHRFKIPVLSNLLFPRYRSEGVHSILKRHPETEMSIASLDRHCFLPSFLINGRAADGPQWLAMAFHNLGNPVGLGDFGKVSVLDAIMASAAAPMYFPPHQIGSQLFADGGIAANNPAMSAMAAATHAGIIGQLGVPLDRVSILSLGTGHTESSYPPQPSQIFPTPYGMLGWMWPDARGATTPGMPALDATFDGVAQLNDFQVRSVVGKDNYRRVQLDFGTESFPMDDCSKVHGAGGLINRTRDYLQTDKWKEISSWVKSRIG